jgi:DNA-binding winged helix-turn-helix (wHTH) protein
LSALLAVEKLARSARWQEKARRDERERAALWPIEPGGEAPDALFLNEEMNTIVASARKVAPTTINVLLTGETGTGKEVLARVIHAASPRAERPFVPFNCTAVPREMIDSQLFGYRRGAFTGAVADYPGVVRAGELTIDEGTYTCRLRGKALDLTFKEFELLKYLAQHPGRVFTRAQLLQEVWGYDYYGGTRTVDVHVRRLRAKLGPEHEVLIGTVRNVGYRFVPGAVEQESDELADA